MSCKHHTDKNMKKQSTLGSFLLQDPSNTTAIARATLRKRDREELDAEHKCVLFFILSCSYFISMKYVFTLLLYVEQTPIYTL